MLGPARVNAGGPWKQIQAPLRGAWGGCWRLGCPSPPCFPPHFHLRPLPSGTDPIPASSGGTPAGLSVCGTQAPVLSLVLITPVNSMGGGGGRLWRPPSHLPPTHSIRIADYACPTPLPGRGPLGRQEAGRWCPPDSWSPTSHCPRSHLPTPESCVCPRLAV